ncbi:hypothetical protein LTR66_009014 [Elasticomyces elasticus]|nr:hypothetical protein LTR66_009014 [Elasticomyces elasticus]
MTDWSWYFPNSLESLPELTFKLSHIRNRMEDNFSILYFTPPNLVWYLQRPDMWFAQLELAALDVLIRASGKAFAQRAIWNTTDEGDIFERKTAGYELKWFMRKRIEMGAVRLLWGGLS